MEILSKQLIELINEYKKTFNKSPEPFWYTEWNTKEDYAEYLKNEIKKVK